MDTLRERFEHVVRVMHEDNPDPWEGKPSIRTLSKKICALSNSTLNNFIRAAELGNEQSPDTSTIAKFESATGFSWQWVLTGNGPERTGLPQVPVDDYGAKLFDGPIGIVMRLADKVIRDLRRQPDLRGVPEARVRQAVLDALFLNRKIKTEVDLALAASRLLLSQSGEHLSAQFRAVSVVPPAPEAPDTRG